MKASKRAGAKTGGETHIEWIDSIKINENPQQTPSNAHIGSHIYSDNAVKMSERNQKKDTWTSTLQGASPLVPRSAPFFSLVFLSKKKKKSHLIFSFPPFGSQTPPTRSIPIVPFGRPISLILGWSEEKNNKITLHCKGGSTNMSLFGRVHECKKHKYWSEKKVWIVNGMKWTLPKNQWDPHRDIAGTQSHLG